MTTTDVEQILCVVCGNQGRRYMNTRACADDSPAALAGHDEPPTPTCNKPTACYLPCCLRRTDPLPVERRHELDERIEAWRIHARAEIITLAGLGYPFGPGDLAALLPVKIAGDHAREWLQTLLDEGIKAGAIERVGDHQWKGARS